jgi:hypothetical protein
VSKNAREKQKDTHIQGKTLPPSNQAIGMINIKFETQEGSNQNIRFLNGKIPYSPPETKTNHKLPLKPSAKLN